MKPRSKSLQSPFCLAAHGPTWTTKPLDYLLWWSLQWINSTSGTSIRTPIASLLGHSLMVPSSCRPTKLRTSAMYLWLIATRRRFYVFTTMVMYTRVLRLKIWLKCQLMPSKTPWCSCATPKSWCWRKRSRSPSSRTTRRLLSTRHTSLTLSASISCQRRLSRNSRVIWQRKRKSRRRASKRSAHSSSRRT